MPSTSTFGEAANYPVPAAASKPLQPQRRPSISGAGNPGEEKITQR
jgi:hypothetical protein